MGRKSLKCSEPVGGKNENVKVNGQGRQTSTNAHVKNRPEQDRDRPVRPEDKEREDEYIREMMRRLGISR